MKAYTRKFHYLIKLFVKTSGHEKDIEGNQWDNLEEVLRFMSAQGCFPCLGFTSVLWWPPI